MKDEMNFLDKIALCENVNKDNAVAVIALGATPDEQWIIMSIHAGFSKVPTNPVLLVVGAGSTILFRHELADDEPHSFLFPRGMRNREVMNEAMVLTLLASGTAGNIGYLNATYI